MHLIMSRQYIINSWESIHKDYHNNRPDIDTPERFIEEAEKGRMTAWGALIVIHELPGENDERNKTT